MAWRRIRNRHSPWICMDVSEVQVEGAVPQPATDRYRDCWDSAYVKLPCSPESEHIYFDMALGRKVKCKRWDTIMEAMRKPMRSSRDIERAIVMYNSSYASQWDFSALHMYCREEMTAHEQQQFFDVVIPEMRQWVELTPTLCPVPIPLLRRQHPSKLTLSQYQVACLLANAFFCTFPRRNSKKPDSEYSSFPSINFNTLFGTRHGDVRGVKVAKLRCIHHYFKRVAQQKPTGVLTIQRCVLSDDADWAQSTAQLTDLLAPAKGVIEDEGAGLLQVDFANKFIGGGVLGHGAVQEEIRFLVCPEMIVSRLVTEMLDPNESILLMGAETYSQYTGYSRTFSWSAPCLDLTPCDQYGRRLCQVVAIDALVFHSYTDQFKESALRRELSKAYCGFRDHGRGSSDGGPLPAVATAAEAGRDVIYFTFGNTELSAGMERLHRVLRKRNKTVGELWEALVAYRRQLGPRDTSGDLFEYLENFCV